MFIFSFVVEKADFNSFLTETTVFMLQMEFT